MDDIHRSLGLGICIILSRPPARTFAIKHPSLYWLFALDSTKMTAIDPDIEKKAAAAAEPSESLPSAHEDLAVGGQSAEAEL
jgi:hypothetical protein